MAESPLAGRHALITGGGTGIGAAAAEHLHAAGAKLSLLGRRLEPLQAIAERHGGIALGCDVTAPDQIGNAFDEARTLNGPIDLLIVNAGIAESAPFHKMTRESWDKIIGTNLTAAFECSRAAIGDLLKSDNGRLVFVASVASLRGVPYAAHYAASKHGLLGLMRSLAAEYAKTNLTVNAVCPGYVDTPLVDAAVEKIAASTGRPADEARAALARRNKSGRFITPAEVAQKCLWLCSPAANGVTGQAITLEGNEP